MRSPREIATQIVQEQCPWMGKLRKDDLVKAIEAGITEAKEQDACAPEAWTAESRSSASP